MATFRLGPLGYEVLVVNFVLTFASLREILAFFGCAGSLFVALL